MTLLVFIWLFFSADNRSFAHPMPHSLIELSIQPERMEALLKLPFGDLSEALESRASIEAWKSDPTKTKALAEYLAHHIEIRDPDGTKWTEAVSPEIEFEDVTKSNPDLVARMVFERASGLSAPPVFVIESDLIWHRVGNRQIFISVKTDWSNGLLESDGGNVVVLNSSKRETVITREAGHWANGFFASVVLGAKHIAEGFDHLCFLLMLVLAACLQNEGRRWTRLKDKRSLVLALLGVVTAFSLGHSLTLICGTFGWLSLPSRLTESLIAVSIIVSAIHVLVPIYPRKEWIVATFFGLIHGLAFSTMIREMGLSKAPLLWTLLGFNSGIELMQLAILTAVFPLLYFAMRLRQYFLLKNVLAALGSAAAVYWLIGA